MASIALDERYLNTLKAFGDVDKLVDEAIEDYLTRRIIERIKTAREKVNEFESKYGMPYAAFTEKMGMDEAFYNVFPTCTQTTSRSWN